MTEMKNCNDKDMNCEFYFYGDCRLPECIMKNRLTIDDLTAINSYLQEVRQKYLKPYRERECLKIEALCQKIERILKKTS